MSNQPCQLLWLVDNHHVVIDGILELLRKMDEVKVIADRLVEAE